MSRVIGYYEELAPEHLAHLVETDKGNPYTVDTCYIHENKAYEVQVKDFQTGRVITTRKFSVEQSGSKPNAEKLHLRMIENLEEFVKE